MRDGLFLLKIKNKMNSLWKCKCLKRQRNMNRMIAISMAYIMVHVLIFPSVSMGAASYCGLEEHQHGEACYEKVLICGLKEAPEIISEISAPEELSEESQDKLQEQRTEQIEKQGHVHNESCIRREVVPYRESVRTAGSTFRNNRGDFFESIFGDGENRPVEELFGDGEGFSANRVTERSATSARVVERYVCEQTENVQEHILEQEAEEVHVHTEACWEMWLICERPEHIHMESCFLNPNIETEIEEEPLEEQSVEEEPLEEQPVEEEPIEEQSVEEQQLEEQPVEEQPLEEQPVEEEPIEEEPLEEQPVEEQPVEEEPLEEPLADMSDGTSTEEEPTIGSEEIVENEPSEDTKWFYSYEDENMVVTATLEYADAIPDQAEFRVTPVNAHTGGYNYDAYMGALNTDGEAQYTADNTLLYDVAFYVDGIEYQPKEGSVSVLFSFKNQQIEELKAEAEQVSVIHLPLTAEVKEASVTTRDAVDISLEDVKVEPVEAYVENKHVSFSLQDFSVVAIAAKNTNALTQAVMAFGDPVFVSETSEADGTGNTGVQAETALDYREILGNAVQFGLTTNTLHIIGHMDSTFAAGTVYSGASVTAGKYTNGVGGSFIIGEVDNRLQIDSGMPIGIYTTSEAKEKIALTVGGGNQGFFVYDTKENLKQQVRNMISHVKTKSQLLQSKSSYDPTAYLDAEGKNLDISSWGSGTFYFNGDKGFPNQEATIVFREDQTIVFNCSGSNVQLGRFRIKTGDMSSPQSVASSDVNIVKYAKNIVFNMPNATEVLVSEGLGIFLAPEATLSIGSTSSGWAVANSIGNPGGEWHFINQQLPVYINVGIEVTKLVDGREPTEAQNFTFQVETRIGDSWENPEMLQNRGRQIYFQKTYGHAGVHYYRISEIAGSEDYIYDSQEYIIKLEITEALENGRRVLRAEKSYYRTGAFSEISLPGKQVNEIVFQNHIPDNAGYVLPEAGGIGTLWHRILGVLVMLGSGFVICRKKQVRVIR